MRFIALAFVSIALASSARAAKLAIIDSGVDYKHKDLATHMWKNPASQTTDADGTVYKSDAYGWNFAEKNNQVIDYKHLGTFPADIKKIFEIQGKILHGTATAEEKAWYDQKKADQAFLKQLSRFGNFVHGTHVSGISAQGADASQIIAIKLIATEPPGGLIHRARALRADDDFMAKFYLGMLAKQQASLLVKIGKYTGAVAAEVANGSFGVSVKSVIPTIKQVMKQILNKDLTDEEAKSYSIYFIQQFAEASKDFVGAAPNTLFVFAAGNDGTNNDQLPTCPANVKTDNSITVAATLGVTALASFSNTGAQMVEVAAPGVVIKSTIPGDDYLELSGTSMAAPFVTNVAGLVKDKNRNLRPTEIKRILMETVDVKEFLRGKVKSSGIVNTQRAAKAAELSRTESLDTAIAQSLFEVADVLPSEVDFRALNDSDLFVVSLPGLF